MPLIIRRSAMRVKNKTGLCPNTPPLGIGGRLKAAVRALGLKQKELAAEYGCSPQFLSDVVRHRNRIPLDMAAWLQEHYSVNLNWLFTGRGPMLLSEDQARAVAEDAAHYEALSDERLIQEIGKRFGERERLRKQAARGD